MEKLLRMANLRALHINNIECGYEEFKDLVKLAVTMVIIEPQLKLAHIRIPNNCWEIVETANARDVAVESDIEVHLTRATMTTIMMLLMMTRRRPLEMRQIALTRTMILALRIEGFGNSLGCGS